MDHAAATPLDSEVKAAMQACEPLFHNPSALYQAAQTAEKAIQEARKSVAQILGARPAEIIFTSGATESNNLAIQGIARSYPSAHFVTSALEHDSVLKPMGYLSQGGYSVTEVSPAASGIVEVEAIAKAITDETVLVSIMYANNEVGTIQPIKEIAAKIKTIKEKRKLSGNDLPLYLHTDAAQAANYLNLNVHRLGVDMMSLNGGKIYGPKQTGVLFAASHVNLQPIILGGGQERGLRSGTPNTPGIIGFATALKKSHDIRPKESQRLKELQSNAIADLLKLGPLVVINGSLKNRLPNNIHLTIQGGDNERLLYALDDLGIQVAVGSACSASNEEPSHVLMSMKMSEADARSSLRISMGRETTKQMMVKFVSALKSVSQVA